MKKIIKNILILPLIILSLMILSFIVSPIINDITLKSFAKQLNKYPLPEKTEFIENEVVCGKLNGNGNGMDFFASILVKSDLSLDELKQYYKNTMFKGAKTNKKQGVTANILPAKGYKLECEYLEHRDVYFSALKDMSDYSKYYIIMLYDGGYSPGFDLRGN